MQLVGMRTGMKVSQITRKRDVCLRKRAGIAQCHRKGPMPVNALSPSPFLTLLSQLSGMLLKQVQRCADALPPSHVFRDTRPAQKERRRHCSPSNPKPQTPFRGDAGDGSSSNAGDGSSSNAHLV